MQAVLEVTAGPHSGQQIVLSPGVPVRIGRTPKADYVVAEDTFLSGAHFYVEWSGDQCIVRDLNSSNGTFLNGTRLSEGILHEGDVITAGQSSFSLKADRRLSDMTVMLPAASHEDTMLIPPVPVPPSPFPEPLQPVTLPPGAPPPPLSAFAVAPAPIPESRLNPAQRGMLDILRGLADPVYAVVDCAAASSFVEALRAAGGSIEVLSETANSGVVKVDAESPLAEQLAADGWGQGWGIYVTSRQPLESSAITCAVFRPSSRPTAWSSNSASTIRRCCGVFSRFERRGGQGSVRSHCRHSRGRKFAQRVVAVHAGPRRNLRSRCLWQSRDDQGCSGSRL